MRRHVQPLLLCSISCAALLTISSCSVAPTYRKERVIESIQEVLGHEQIDATVRLIDQTLAVQFEYPEALARVGDGTQVGLGPGFDKGARLVITAIHRVLLSSDADIQFYLLLVSDPEIPGAYLTLVRYLDDIRKAYVSIIGSTELMSRTIYELKVVGTESLTLDKHLQAEIQLPDFLTWQLKRRLQQTLTDALQPLGVASVGQCQGLFRDGEFAFALNVVPTSGEPLKEETIRLIFETATKLIADVLSDYEFESFDSIHLIHSATGRHFVTPRAGLKFFR